LDFFKEKGIDRPKLLQWVGTWGGGGGVCSMWAGGGGGVCSMWAHKII